MSVVKLLKDHMGKKAGAVLDAVPFLEAKALVAAGVAERANKPAPSDRRADGPDYPALLAAEKAKVAALEAELADLKAAAEKQTKPADAPPKK